MWKQFVKDYLRFTKKDRVGITVLVSLIFLVLLLPYIWPAKKVIHLSKQELETLRAQVTEINKHSRSEAITERPGQTGPAYSNTFEKPLNHEHAAALFYFDPNTLDIAGWKRLGVREKTAQTIAKYLAKGGRFRQASDISKIYGLSAQDCTRLLPYVKIAAAPGFEKQALYERKNFNDDERPAYKIKPAMARKPLDINQADTTAFIALPGIGSKLAARIIAFRQKLGGFYSVRQVSETYGLPDSTFNAIQAMLECNNAMVQKMNINTADANTLKQHPYIRWNLANAIVQYRSQHGNFKAIEDLQQIAVITPDIFEKLKAYLAIQ